LAVRKGLPLTLPLLRSGPFPPPLKGGGASE